MSDYKTRAKKVKDSFDKPASEKVSELWNRLTAKPEETEEQKKKRKRKEQAARAIQQYGSSDEE